MSEVRSKACGYPGEAHAERALESCPPAGGLNPGTSAPKPGQGASPSSKQKRGAPGPTRGPRLLPPASGSPGLSDAPLVRGGAWPQWGVALALSGTPTGEGGEGRDPGV